MSVNKDKYKASIDFPDPRHALVEGLVAVGGVIDVGTLYHAYKRGIFPWPQEGLPLLWFCPEQRGIIFFAELHLPKSLLKEQRRKTHWLFTRNQAFAQVIEACRQQQRPGQQGTWILPEFIQAYSDLQKAGYAHSIEVWEDNKLIGGIYGVMIDGVFSGESMFFKKKNASKMALLHLIEWLQSQDVTWMDVQMVTPVIQAFGGRYISRDDFLNLLEKTQKINAGK